MHYYPKAVVPIPAPLMANGRRCILTINTIAEVMHVSPPLMFADAPVCAIEPPVRFEGLTMAMTERCAITIYLAFGGTDGNTLNVTHRHRLDFGHVKRRREGMVPWSIDEAVCSCAWCTTR